MRLCSPKFLLATIFALFALALNLSAPVASASGQVNKSSSHSVSSHSDDSDHSDDADSEECASDGEASRGHSSSAPVSASSKKSISIPAKRSSSYGHDSHDSEDGDDDGEDSCGNGGSGGGDTPAEIAKRVPKTIGTPTIASCTADAALTWSTVLSPGYAVVDSYRVQYSSNGGTTWTTYGTTTATTSLTLTGLTAGLTYVFQVAAHNANGWGAWSASTTGCALTAVGPAPVYNFIVTGFANVPKIDPALDTWPTVYFDFGNDLLQPGFLEATVPLVASGIFTKGLFTYDLYISLPQRPAHYTFTVTDGSSATYLGNSDTVRGVKDPSRLSSGNFPYTLFETYGININPGATTLSILINP